MADRFVVVAAGSGEVQTSDDAAVTWVDQSAGFSGRILDVQYANGIWLACDDTNVGSSTDGATWSLNAAPSDSINALAYGAGCWIAADDYGHVWRSTNNGVSWAAQTTGMSINNVEPLDVIWDSYNGQFVLGGVDFVGADVSLILTSPDGITWTRQPVITGVDEIMVLATDGAGTLIAGFFPKPFGGTALKIIRSTDGGVSWAKQTTPFTSTNFINDIIWVQDDAQFVAVGDGPTIATSPDGVTWTVQTGHTFDFRIACVAWGAGSYVAVGAAGETSNSSDGVTWTEQTPAFSGVENANHIAFGTTSVFVPTFFADAVIRRTQTATFSADATVTDAHLVHADAVIRAMQSHSFSADAAIAFSIIDVQTGRNPHDRAEQHFGLMPATQVAFDRFNSVEQKLRYAWDRLSLYEAGGYKEASFTASAMVRRVVTSTFKMDAAFVLGGVTVLSWTADAIVRRTQTGSATANAVLRRGRTGSATANAVLRKAGAGSITADSYILARRTSSFTGNAILFKTVTGSFTANAAIGNTETGLLGDHTLATHELGGGS